MLWEPRKTMMACNFSPVCGAGFPFVSKTLLMRNALKPSVANAPTIMSSAAIAQIGSLCHRSPARAQNHKGRAR